MASPAGTCPGVPGGLQSAFRKRPPSASLSLFTLRRGTGRRLIYAWSRVNHSRPAVPGAQKRIHPLKKTLATIALAATLSGLGAGVAQANEGYPAPASPSTVSQGSVEAGESVTFAGSGFTAGEDIIITVEAAPSISVQAGAGSAGRSVAFRVSLAPSQLSTVADAAGKFSVEVMLSEAGTYTLTAKGAASGVTVSNTVVALAPRVVAEEAVQGALANTGLDSRLVALGFLGGVIVAAGTVSIVVAKRGKIAEPST